MDQFLSTRLFASEEFADRFHSVQRAGVLTDAGLSTIAGKLDFRGSNGLYVTHAYDREAVFKRNYFDSDSVPFYAFSRDFLGLLSDV